MKKGFRADVEASKALAFKMVQKKKASMIPDKKKFNKKRERRKNKVKI